MTARLQIGEVAEATGLSLRTIRHYEEVGLVAVPARSPGGFRLYTDAAVARLLAIRAMKPLDLSLEQMGELLDALDLLAAAPSPGLLEVVRGYAHLVADRRDRLRSSLREIDAFHTTLTERVAARG